MKFKSLCLLISLMTLVACSGSVPTIGVNNGRLLACPDSPNCVNSQLKGSEHFIEPLVFGATADEVSAKLTAILQKMDRVKILVSGDKYIKAESTSLIFRFVDDVEFYFPEQDGEVTIIHVRSASRIGKSDLGVNRKRIELIRRLLKHSVK